MLNDASLDLEGALREYPSPGVEEILALLADNRPSDVDFGLDGLFGLSTESGEYSDSGRFVVPLATLRCTLRRHANT